MSMLSIASSRVQPGFATVDSKGYRFTTTMSMGRIPWASIVRMCSRFPRRASSPPWIFGFSVFTRPSSISGKPVYSSISRTGTFFSRRSFAVPPEAYSSTPSLERERQNSAIPALSDTLMIARWILAMVSCPSFAVDAFGGTSSRPEGYGSHHGLQVVVGELDPETDEGGAQLRLAVDEVGHPARDEKVPDDIIVAVQFQIRAVVVGSVEVVRLQAGAEPVFRDLVLDSQPPHGLDDPAVQGDPGELFR